MEGRPVLLVGVTDAPDLNGLGGTCMGYDTAFKRYVILLKDGRSVYIKGGQLKLLANEDDDNEERRFTAAELANMDRRELNLRQNDLSRAKRVHHTSATGPHALLSSTELATHRENIQQNETQEIGRQETESMRIPSSLSLSHSDSSRTLHYSSSIDWGHSHSSSSFSFTGSVKKSEAKNTFADDEIHHAVKSLIKDKVSQLSEADLCDAYRHPGTAGYMSAKADLASRLGRELHDNEAGYLDLMIKDRYHKRASSYSETPTPVVRQTAGGTPVIDICAELNDEDPRPQGTGVPQQHWDPEAGSCGRCGEEFTLVRRRRHHCRGCGINVCADCSPHTASFPAALGYGDSAQRICVTCFDARKVRAIDKMVNFGCLEY